MILALAAGKAASSITSLVFFIEDDVFVYLLNWNRRRIPGPRVPAALVAGRQGRLARRPALKAPAGAAGRRASNSASDRGGTRPW